MNARTPLHLFEAYGVELEYMIVDARTLDVRPMCDVVLHAVAGEYASEVELGAISWSNELALHVVELKTTGPADSLGSLSTLFHEHVRKVNGLLAPHEARLMPGGMHPWMRPVEEMRLWPHEYNAVYEAFNRIFDCRGHGWANLQSVHLNLPFADDEEFGRLHAAVRLILPILPALAASSPVFDARLSGACDNRLDVYRHNAGKIPSITGAVVPEPVFTRAEYEMQILARMYADIAPHDPEGILRHEWLNARGAIARFDRGTIEIRALDVQECPRADLAICQAVTQVLRLLASERWTRVADQKAFDVDRLASVLLANIRDADRALIDDREYLRQFGFSPEGGACASGDLWRHLCAELAASDLRCETVDWPSLEIMLQAGPLARRIANSLSGDVSRERLRAVYGELCDCLAENRMFMPS